MANDSRKFWQELLSFGENQEESFRTTGINTADGISAKL